MLNLHPVPASIFLAGPRGAGKTTTAELLEREAGAAVVKVTQPLYEIAARYFGMAGKDRLLLQRLGDAFRAADPAWLAKWAEREAEALAGAAPVLVIEGIRTVEEAEYLTGRGGCGVYVDAPASLRLARRLGEPQEADRHHTEAGLAAVERMCRWRLWNDGAEEDLRRAALGVCAAVGIERVLSA